MGYIERQLSRALARLGVEVHVVAANLQAYHGDPNYRTTYERFLGPAVQECGIEQFEGITLHRLPHSKLLGYVRVGGLSARLAILRPDVVQAFAVASWIPLAAAAAQIRLRYRFFTGAHQTMSVMSPTLLQAGRLSRERLRSDVRRAIPGRLVSLRTTLCYAATSDCGEVARRFYGVQAEKIVVAPLAVDTDVFQPPVSASDFARRRDIRAAIGVRADEVVCVYTGRFSEAKNPLCLADAIARLRAKGLPFKAWFYGDGPQRAEIAARDGCEVRTFVDSSALRDIYQAADIGVWPTQESVSMLDAAACGLPVVVSDRLRATERIEGNGRTYVEGDPEDLAAVLASLEAGDIRMQLGSAGARKIAGKYSWSEHARRKLRDYEAALTRTARRV